MELNNGYSQEGDEDRLSSLTDDILLSILGRVNITTATRTSVLSTRWKHLPWLLRELTIDVKDFLPAPHPKPIEAQHMDAAMASLTKAIRSFLPYNRCGVSISRLQLKFYLVNNYSDVIGPLVSEAINIGTIRDLDLAIVDEKNPDDCYVEEMLDQARSVDEFFRAYPSVLNCLTKLSLYNICFADWDMHHILFNCCKQLRHLYLSNCDAGGLSVWKINAPDSKLSVLELYVCLLGRLEVISLPKLERLRWDGWICPNAPLSLGVVPSLKELCLFCVATVNHNGFKLSEVLSDTTAIHNLTLNFQGEKLWIQPEGKQLCTAFNKLIKLCLHDIYIELDLLWMMVLLEAAPSVEIFDIEEDLWLSAFPIGTEWENIDKIKEFNWNFENLEKTLEEGGELYGKTVYLFGSTEPQLLDVNGESKIVLIPIVVAVDCPFPPSDKIGINSVQRENEEIVPMKAMKMAWVPYVPLEDRLSRIDSLKTKIFTLGCTQRRSALKHLKTERVKKFDYCMPYYMPLNPPEDEDDTVVNIIYPLEPPIVCDFDWEMDDYEDFVDEKVKDEVLPEDEKEKFKEFLKEKVRERKRELKQGKEVRKKAIDDMDPKTREAFENIKFYKFYPVTTPDTPDVTNVKAKYINRYYRNAHYLM